MYDGTLHVPGGWGVELHANRVLSGRTTAEPPELPSHHQSHLTLEPSLGLLPWWELGGYFQTAFLADGSFEYAGVKLRSKFATPEGTFDYWRFGLNVEGSLLPSAFDPNHVGTELRPIASFENDWVLLAVNPIVDISYSGDNAGPAFEPAAMAKAKLGGAFALGAEYYAALGPFSSLLPWHEQEHYIYEVFDVLTIPFLEINAGFGQGLTEASNDFVAKLILGYTHTPHGTAPAGRY